MDLKTEDMKNMKKTVAKCLGDLMKKNDLSPAETKAALDGLALHDELCCRIEDCEKEEKMSENEMYSERGYSMYGEPYREYHITSYGMPNRAMYSERSYGMSRNVSMPRPMEYSGGPQYGVHGWYQSNNYPVPMDDRGYYSPEYMSRGMGYSRHSISDRAVSSLENLFDVAASDYEKHELKKYISMIRAAGMSD